MTHPSEADLIVVGAGPAGMRAAVCAARGGLSVVVLESQARPGGQIWRDVDRNADDRLLRILGPDYRRGIRAVEDFVRSGAVLIPRAEVSRIEPGWRVDYVCGDRLHEIRAPSLLLATGAQERPVPFDGWTLPGVMTVGAAQILLKTAGQLPRGPVVVAGNGPLPLLFQSQMRAAGLAPAAFLDTTPKGFVGRALRHLPDATRDFAAVLKGVALLPWFGGVPHVGGVVRLRAEGGARLEAVRFETAAGRVGHFEAATLLVHEGLVPSHQLAVSAGAELAWDEAQAAFGLRHDEWMQAGATGLHLAGDGVRIGGAANAELEGEIAALGVLLRIGALSARAAETRAAPLRRRWARQRAFRRFLDALYRPSLALAEPEDATIVCRCEELRAAELRDIARRCACAGPNQLKAFTRVGMGPCQGRQCGYAVHQIVKSATGLPADRVGLFNPRPPFAPTTVAMLAGLPDDRSSGEGDHG